MGKTMKLVFLLLNILIGLCSSAQEWAPIGATWHYRSLIFEPPPQEGYHRFEVTADTVINGQMTRKVTSSTYSSTIYTHDLDGLAVIFVPGLDLFDTLFDINAIPGDRWGMVPLPEPMWCSTESWVEVVDTGTTSLNAVQLRWLAVNYHYLAEEVEYLEPDTIMERLGPMAGFMLPHEWCNQVVSPGFISDLYCYSDALVEYIEPGIVDCDLAMGLAQLAPTKLEVFPNPGKDRFTVSGLNGNTYTRITMRDAFGRVVQARNVTATNAELNTTDLRTGVYFVEIENSAMRQDLKWIKQ